MADQISWETFDYRWGSAAHDAFEDLCRMFFRHVYIKDPLAVMPQKRNQDGLETEPIEINNELVGFQSKYFTSSVNYLDIKDSLEKAAEKYKGLKEIKLFSNKSFSENSSKTLSITVKHLAELGIRVTFLTGKNILDPIRDSKDLLSLASFFFGRQSFDEEWFKNESRLALQNLEPKYIPDGLHVTFESAELRLAALAKTQRLLDYVNGKIGRVLKELKKHPPFSAVKDPVNSMRRKLSDVRFCDKDKIQLCFNVFDSIKPEYEKLCEQAKSLSNKRREFLDLGDYSEADNTSSDLSALDHIISCIEELDFRNSGWAFSLNSPILLIGGEANYGKSHLLGYFTELLLNEPRRNVLLILGSAFRSNGNPSEQLASMLDLRIPFFDFIDCCEAKGKTDGIITTIIIDALNEAHDKAIWLTYINRLISRIEGCSFVKLVLSIRNGFEAYVFNDHSLRLINEGKLPRIDVPGFRHSLSTAVPLFFNHYKLPLSSSDILNSEFENPLFLSIYCKSMQEANPREPNGFFDVYERYLRNREVRIKREESLADHGDCWYAIAKAIGNHYLNTGFSSIQYETLASEIGNDAEKVFDGFVHEKVILKYIRERDGRRLIYYNFAFERFFDHAVATALLNKYETKETLLSYLKEDLSSANPKINPAIFGALSAILGKRGWSIFRAIEQVSNHYRQRSYVQEWLDAMQLRDNSAIRADEFREFMASSLGKMADLGEVWDLLLSLSLRNCELDAYYIHGVLSGMTMTNRDSRWTIHINGFERNESAIWNLIDVLQNEKMVLKPEEKKKNCIILGWLLTSSNRLLRDCSSRALVSVFANDPQIMVWSINTFNSVDDPYVTSRLMGCVYGALLTSEPKTINEDDGRSLANAIHDWIFKPDITYPDILIRDYARMSLKYLKKIGITIPFDEKTIEPQNYVTIEIPNISVNHLNDLYGNDYSTGLSSIKRSMTPEYSIPGFIDNVVIAGDFGKYVIGPAMRNFLDADLNLAYKYMFAYICDKLGYTNDLFSDYDRSVGYVLDRKNHAVERIGKKYEWIAFYHVLSLVSDRWGKVGTFSETPTRYAGAWNPYVRDFDPSLRFQRNEDRTDFACPILFDFPVQWNIEDKKWAFKDELDKGFEDAVVKHDAQGTRWFALHSFLELRSEDGEYQRYQEVWRMFTCLFVKTENMKEIEKQINENGLPFNFRELMDLATNYVCFDLEYPWSEACQYAYRRDEPLKLEFKIGEEEKEVEMPNVRFLFPEGLEAWSIEEEDDDNAPFKKTTRMEPIYAAFDAMPSACEYLWEEEYDYSKEGSISIRLPSPELANILNLSYLGKGKCVDEAGNNLAVYHRHVSGSNVNDLCISETGLKRIEKAGFSPLWLLMGENLHSVDMHKFNRRTYRAIAILDYNNHVVSLIHDFEDTKVEE